MKVLIADDSDAIVNRLVSVLGGTDGIDVVGRTATVDETDRAIRTLRPDAIVLDLHMPGGHGIDVLDGLRRDRLSPIVIVLTNDDHPQFRRKCLEKGARFFLDKSTDFDLVGEILIMLTRYKDSKDSEEQQ
jgi:DNA-binding NarL/FixJ family response regulator